jgi:amidohydrolase
MKTTATRIKDEAERVFPEVVALRRDFHAHPELSFKELRTSETIASTLKDLGLEVRADIATTGVVGLLRGHEDGPTIVLRADMDALPIQEKTGLPFASTNPGVMHACGHDGHMAMLLGAARVLVNMREHLRGNVKFLFQPGEEGYAGARKMIEEGVLEDEPRIRAAFALHLDSLSAPGTLGIREGPIMACADMFSLTIIGKGGHGAVPHVTIDPVFVSGHVITALQGIASRRISAMDSVIVSICRIHGGEAMSVIPDIVEMGGTVRMFEPRIRSEMPAMMEDIIRGVTSAFGADYRFDYIHGYPATVNDTDFTELVRSAARALLGENNIRELARPRMPSEDFSFFLERVPGTFALLGARSSEREAFSSHNAAFDIDENALKAGVMLHTGVALSYLGNEL